MTVKIRSANPNSAVVAQEAGNLFGEALVAQGLPPYTESTRLGQLWSTMSTTAFAAKVARPAAINVAVEIFNAGASTLVIDRIFCEWRAATAAASSAVMYAMVGPQTAPTAGVFAIRGSSGKAYSGQVIVAVNQSVVDNGWFPWGNSITAALAAATPNGGQDSRVEGRLFVPPGHALCLDVVASLVGDTFIQGASWWEVNFGAGELL